MNKEECTKFIKEFFEDYYNKLCSADKILVTLPDLPEEMWAYEVNPKDEWKQWRLIPSTVTDEELNKLEEEIGIKLPMMIRIFLSTYYHYFEDGIGINPTCEHFSGIKNAWNPILVKAGYLPFAWDEEGYFIRCIDLKNMNDEEKCKVYQISHEILFGFDEDTVNKEEIDKNMEYLSENFFTYLKEILNK